MLSEGSETDNLGTKPPIEKDENENIRHKELKKREAELLRRILPILEKAVSRRLRGKLAEEAVGQILLAMAQEQVILRTLQEKPEDQVMRYLRGVIRIKILKILQDDVLAKKAIHKKKPEEISLEEGIIENLAANAMTENEDNISNRDDEDEKELVAEMLRIYEKREDQTALTILRWMLAGIAKQKQAEMDAANNNAVQRTPEETSSKIQDPISEVKNDVELASCAIAKPNSKKKTRKDYEINGMATSIQRDTGIKEDTASNTIRRIREKAKEVRHRLKLQAEEREKKRIEEAHKKYQADQAKKMAA